MAVTFMQRRASGIRGFRKRLTESLADKPAPEHVRQAFPDLVNATKGHFKREVVRSLEETDKGKALRANAKLTHETLLGIDAALNRMAEDPARVLTPPATAQIFTASDLRSSRRRRERRSFGRMTRPGSRTIERRRRAYRTERA